jgi:nucleotide-binding universal stress UspA family protein
MPASSPVTGPVLFAYDGSDLAELAIGKAAHELPAGRDALVVCVWQPGDVGFVTPQDGQLKANDASEVRKAAAETAARGASLAEAAGFRARSLAVEAAPTWKGIVDTAAEHDATLIVIGSHRRKGIAGHLLGSVTDAVVSHTAASVLIAHT